MPDSKRGPIDRPLPLADPIDAAPLPALLQALDKESWRALYLGQRRLVRGVLANFIGYGVELDDLTQQVFATAASLVYSGKVVLHGDASGLKAWLAAIADRIGRGELRRRKTARETAFMDENPVLVDFRFDPVAHQTLGRVRQVLERLPERLRSPWVFRHLERMTIDEVAAALGVSPATVKRRVSEADELFGAMANEDPVLRDYLRGDGGRA